MPRGIDERKEHVAELGCERIGIGLALEFGEFLADFIPDVVGGFPIEADMRGFLLHALCPKKRRQMFGHARQDRVPPFLHLEPLPVLHDLVGTVSFDVTENMRMASDEFFGDVLDDVAQGERTTLFGDDRVHDDVQKQIAQLFFELGIVAAFDRIERFVRFLDEQM